MRPWSVLCMGVLMVMVGACAGNAAPTITATPAPTLVPSITPVVFPTLPPAFTPTPLGVNTEPNPELTEVLVDPLTGILVEPPLTINLPLNWLRGYETILFQDVGDVVSIPFALYKGDVSGGTGTIVLLWNFRSITTGNPLSSDYGQPNLWIDGERLLRSLIFENTCNIGTYQQRDFVIGGLPATGTDFQVADCLESPDTRGWFAGLNVGGINFLFFAYTDPISAMDGLAKQELQAIFDSIIFTVDTFKARQ